MKPASREWSAASLRKVIADRFPYPEFATFFEVANTTGFEKKRFADAISVSMWESRGLSISGFEFKVSRGDLLRELRAPEKMEPFFEHVHQWWLVTPPGLLKEHKECLPSTWGLMECHGTPQKAILKRIIQAPDRPVSEQMCRRFFTVLMRHAFDKRPEARLLKEAFQEGSQQASEYHARIVERTVKDTGLHVERLKKQIAEFRERTGINIHDRWGWPSKQLIRAWEKFDEASSALEFLQSTVKRIEGFSEEALKSFAAAKEAAGIKSGENGETQ